jgi:hypothetical protein
MKICFKGKLSEFEQMVPEKFGTGFKTLYVAHKKISRHYLKNPNYVHPEGKTEAVYGDTAAYTHIATWNHKKREGWILE